MSEFYSVRRLPPYVFEQVNRLKASARAAGADIIDLGMGNPDLPTPAHIVDKLADTARRDDTHGYSASRGITGLRRAQAAYYGAPLRREGRPQQPGDRHHRLEGRLRQHGAGDHRAGRRGALPQPELPDPRLRLPDGRRRHPFAAGGAGRELFPRPRAGGDALDPEAAGGGGLLPVEPDGACRRPRLLPRPGQLRPAQRPDPAVGPRLFGGLFRRRAAAFDPAGAGRDGRRGRVHLDVEDLFDGRLAHAASRSATSG